MSDEKNSKVLSVSQVEVCKRVKKKKENPASMSSLAYNQVLPLDEFFKNKFAPRSVCVCLDD